VNIFFSANNIWISVRSLRISLNVIVSQLKIWAYNIHGRQLVQYLSGLLN
jgi:hypothetical protein